MSVVVMGAPSYTTNSSPAAEAADVGNHEEYNHSACLSS